MASSPEARKSLLVPGLIERGVNRVRAGEFPDVLKLLIEEAEAACSIVPPSVLDKKHVPPSGDKRDYFSLSIYFWPDPAKSDGLPYIPRDGQVNPECDEYDRNAMNQMAISVDTLSFAYAATGEERYADKAATFLRVWFVDETTAMRPNMLFAQYIPGDNVTTPWKEYPARYVPGTEGRKGAFVSYGGTIEDCTLFPVMDCVRILGRSPHWTEADDRAVRVWFGQYASWLGTHQHGLDEAACRNNHGSWYWAGITAFLEFAGHPAEAASAASGVLEERLRLQIEPDGSQPEELVRAISQSYTAFTIASFVNLAIAAERCGFDAWSVKTEDGRCISKSIEWIVPYLSGEKEWVWKQIKPFDPESMIGPLAAWAERFPGAEKREILGRITLPLNHRDRMLYDIPFGTR